MTREDMDALMISILAPTRGATGGTAPHRSTAHNFNPRSHEGSDLLSNPWVCPPQDFNPRSHEGSDFDQTAAELYEDEISILAPTRGATPCEEFQFLCLWISILAPTRGATILPNGKHINAMHFNPRSHEGSDLIRYKKNKSKLISILAPTRGATPSRL